MISSGVNQIMLSIAQTCVVTVTYGDRYHFLQRILERVLSLGIRHIVVVDNGSQRNSAEKLDRFAAKNADSIHIVRLGKNIGSAGGYKAGIKNALACECKFIWLLDDDNLPAHDSLTVLFGVYGEQRTRVEISRLALLAFRSEHQADIAMGVDPKQLFLRPGSFWGFHLLDIPFKIWRRTPWGRPRAPTTGTSEVVPMLWAPYSGLFFHRSVVGRIGFPYEDFVLYGDDNEYTVRLTQNGGEILLVTRAHVEDLETSWNAKIRFGNSFKGWLCGRGDMRAYYGARNQTYLDHKLWSTSKVWIRLNEATYLSILWLYAICLGRRDRAALLKAAVDDAKAGRLGQSSRFKLP